MSTEEITTPSIGVTWFNLSRHAGDEPANVGEPTADEAADDAEAQQLLADATEETDSEDAGEPEPEDDEPDTGLGDAGKKALDRMKAERAAAKKEAVTAKKAAAEERRQRAELARKVAEFEDRDRSELEKAQAKAERQAELATKAVARAVKAEVRALAVGKFADASDATDVLMRDPQKYVDADGEIDTDAIDTDLADLLERKPHWGIPVASAEPEAPKRVKPKADPAQGSRGPVPPTDFRTASKEDLAAELSKFGYRQRSA